MGRALERGKLPDNGRAAKIPMLMMHGGDDQICDPQASRVVAARLVKEGQPVEYIEWPGLYHEIHNGGPDSTGDEVIERMIQYFRSL